MSADSPEKPDAARAFFEAETFAPGPMLAGRYRVEREVGRGGMGAVFLAHDTLLGADVAVKLLPALLARDQAAMERLKAEARIAMRLGHPNIARVHTLEESPQGAFLVMEYVEEGRTLKDLIQERGKLALEDLLPIAEQVAAGLDYAHAQAVLHRDIKPSNVLLKPDGTAKVSDFGIAREMTEAAQRLTGQGTSGTPLYMSPEQMLGRPLDARSDIYSFGAVLYEALSGHPPFTRGHLPALVLHEQPADLQGVPAHVNAAVQEALAKSPADRPASAAAVVSLFAGGAAMAGPPTQHAKAPVRLRSIWWRPVAHPALLLTGVLALALAAVVLLMREDRTGPVQGEQVATRQGPALPTGKAPQEGRLENGTRVGVTNGENVRTLELREQLRQRLRSLPTGVGGELREARWILESVKQYQEDGETFIREDDYPRAGRAFKKAHDRLDALAGPHMVNPSPGPPSREEIFLEAYEDILAMSKKSLIGRNALNPPPDATQLELQAARYARIGDYEGALTVCEKVIARYRAMIAATSTVPDRPDIQPDARTRLMRALDAWQGLRQLRTWKRTVEGKLSHADLEPAGGLVDMLESDTVWCLRFRDYTKAAEAIEKALVGYRLNLERYGWRVSGTTARTSLYPEEADFEELARQAQSPASLHSGLLRLAEKYEGKIGGWILGQTATQKPDWDAITEWADMAQSWDGNMYPDTPSQLRARREAADAYLRRRPTSPLRQPVKRYLTYLGDRTPREEQREDLDELRLDSSQRGVLAYGRHRKQAAGWYVQGVPRPLSKGQSLWAVRFTTCPSLMGSNSLIRIGRVVADASDTAPDRQDVQLYPPYLLDLLAPGTMVFVQPAVTQRGEPRREAQDR